MIGTRALVAGLELEPPQLAGLGDQPAIRRWLAFEQTVNERRVHPRVFHAIGDSGVHAAHRAEARACWRLELAWVPEAAARRIGDVDGALGRELGIAPRAGLVALPIHPQGRGLFRSAALETTSIEVTPTASERALLAWRRRRACVVKLSLAAVIGGRRRVVYERDIARAVLMSRLFAEVPEAHRRALRLEAFADLAGAATGGRGYLLRGLPPCLREELTLVPLFSLVSRRAGRRSLVEEAALEAGGDPLDFAAREVLAPYVQALAHLLFEHGIAVEPHAQNVAVAVGRDRLVERVVLRDFSDASVDLGLRLARGHALPGDGPSSWYDEAVRPRRDVARLRHRASLAIVRYGMYGVVWSLQRALRRTFPKLSRLALYRVYLQQWQTAAAHYLGFIPARHGAHALDVDDAIAAYLRSVDWRALGAVRRHRPPADARPLPRVAGRRPRGYLDIECAWGRLGLADDGAPAYFVART